ncbi:hypothetical protein BC943DRAFT_319490 [Umbelopsis sp. AD052]|nr:hypothetical protein BC943DRAFT_319490 [Umbelopsis sp. AD052]
MFPRIASPTKAANHYPSQHNNDSNTTSSSKIPSLNSLPQADYNIRPLEWNMSKSTSSSSNTSVMTPSHHTRPPSRVKVYYSFEGDMKSCYTAFNYHCNVNPDTAITNVPLSQCLLAVSRASPEMFFDSQEFSVYSMSYEEIAAQPPSDTAKNIIWEGHGLFSWVIENEQRENKQISGEVFTTSNHSYMTEIRVTLKLKWTNRLADSASKPTEHAAYEAQSTSNGYYSIYRDKGKQPALEAPFTNTMMNHQSSSLRSHFPENRQHSGTLLHQDLPSIVPRKNSMEDRRRLPMFSSNPSVKKNTEEDEEADLEESDGSNYDPTHEELESSLQKHPRRSAAKKRKAKETDPKSGRFYYEMERDHSGQPILPVEIDSWTVISLGVIDAERPAFHTARYIYPIGYTIKKWYRSMVDAKRDTQYTCRIVDGGEEPRFQVEADDNRGTVFEGRTPTTVWTEVVRKAFSIRNLDYQHSPVGPEFFGLRKNAIAKMIQDLPHAKKCRKYVWQTFRATMSGKAGRNRRRINNLGTLSPELSEQQQQSPTVINLDKPIHNH